MTRDLLFTLSFIATRASAESADIGTTPFVRRGYRASPIGLVADECRERLSLPPSHPRSRLARVIRGKADLFKDRDRGGGGRG